MNVSQKFTAENVYKELKKKARLEKVAVYSRFFKTGKGQYGEGDVFLGITVPDQRSVTQGFLVDLRAEDLVSFFKKNKIEIEKLLKRKEHECRLTALLMLVGILRLSARGLRGSRSQQNARNLRAVHTQHKDLSKSVFDFYIKNIKYVNNWDLVDCSTPDIVGIYLFEAGQKNLLQFIKKFADSKNLWERRVAVLACFYAIKRGDFDGIKFATHKLIKDKHDLIHKALGWMLREMGKKDKSALVSFLRELLSGPDAVPRTTLRYAIERFNSEEKRVFMLK